MLLLMSKLGSKVVTTSTHAYIYTLMEYTLYLHLMAHGRFGKTKSTNEWGGPAMATIKKAYDNKRNRK